MSEPTTELPFQSVSADLFSHCGWEYIVYVDRMSGWPCVGKLGRTCDSSSVIKIIRSKISEIGVPVKMSIESSWYWYSGRHPGSKIEEVDEDRSGCGYRKRRDYYVKTPSGAVYWRNRRFLRPLTSAVN
ncbi:hypothetical protein TCAL_15473, partial [Tigriopus californicus]